MSVALRITIEYPDGVPDSVEVWPNAERDIHTTFRWGRMMERLTPGAVMMEPETYCDDHGRWEVADACERCSEWVCAEEAAACRERIYIMLCEHHAYQYESARNGDPL